jgi:hypothetical protein
LIHKLKVSEASLSWIEAFAFAHISSIAPYPKNPHSLITFLLSLAFVLSEPENRRSVKCGIGHLRNAAIPSFPQPKFPWKYSFRGGMGEKPVEIKSFGAPTP